MLLRRHMVGNFRERPLTGYENQGEAPLTARQNASRNRASASSVLAVRSFSQCMVDLVRTKADLASRRGIFHGGRAARFSRTGDAHQPPSEIHRCGWRTVRGRQGHAGVGGSRSVESRLTFRDTGIALVPGELWDSRSDQITAVWPAG